MVTALSTPDGTRATSPAAPREPTEGAAARPLAVADLAAAYRSGAATPSQIAERALVAAEALERLDPPMRAFLALDPEDVRRQAASATARFREGRALGPLDGVPVAIKDELDVVGYRSTHGTGFLGERAAARDSAVVARLRAAGAVLFGKTNMHELGLGPSGANPHHGAARNPYDPARDTGGSSSGSAAAVASGVVPLALGTDSGGSLRVPGALCGVPSIKPTYGLVSTEGAAVRTWSLEHFGPLGASVACVATALAVLTDGAVGACTDDELRAVRRVGVCDAWWSQAGAEVAAVAHHALGELLARTGAAAHAVTLPRLALAKPVATATFGVEAAVSLEPHLDARRAFGASAQITLSLARALSATAFVNAQRARALVAQDFDRALADADVIVTPTTGVTAPRYSPAALGAGEVDEALIDRLVCFTLPINLVGLPAAQVPCGYDRDGMPVGLQIIGRRGADALVLALAALVERATRWQRPRVHHALLAPR